MQKIQIGLIEDQFLFREGLKAILQTWEDIEVVFESPDGHSVQERLSQTVTIPQVMLVDLSLPPKDGKEFNGLHVTRFLLEHYPQTYIIILSAHQDEAFIAQLIEEGAHGYLVKDSDPQEVHDAIVSVFTKGSYINAKTLKAIQQNMGKKAKPIKAHDDITKREIEILQLTCQQFTADEIADKLFISVKTVNGHRNNLLQKTGSRNVTGLVIYAIKNGIVEV
jgi:two-component system, NarL family, response regulator NreC